MKPEFSMARLASKLALVAMTASAMAGGPAAAQQSAPAAQVSPEIIIEQKAPRERMICKTRVGTASRLNVEKVCKTRTEWDALEEEAKSAISNWTSDQAAARRDRSCIGNGRSAQC